MLGYGFWYILISLCHSEDSIQVDGLESKAVGDQVEAMVWIVPLSLELSHNIMMDMQFKPTSFVRNWSKWRPGLSGGKQDFKTPITSCRLL